MAIATDALRMALELELTGANEALSELQRVNSAIDTLNGKSARAAEALELQRMSVEGKYNPDIQRDYEIEKAIKLTKELNLSLAAQDAILEEIAEKYKVATTAVGPAQDAHVNDYLRGLQLQEQADRERAATREKVSREVAKIEEQELSNRQRYVARMKELQGQLRTGDITFDQAKVLAGRAKADYQAIEDAENKKAKIKQDAIDKQENQNKFERTKQTDHYLKMKALRDKEATEARNTIKMGAQEFAPMVDFNAIMTDNNKARRQAIALMNSYSSVADRAAADTLTFNAALANGTITAEEHARAVAGVDARMRSMAGGAGNMGYVVGNVMTGLEDFTTVLSITGFGMDGFAAATRSASNNVGQAVRGMGTAYAAMLAPMVSIGMVLAGFAIPAIYRWVTGAEEAADSTKQWADELAKLQRMMTVGSSEALLNFDRMMTEKDIKKLFDVDKLKDDLDSSTDAVKRLGLELDDLINKNKASGIDALTSLDGMSGVMPLGVLNKFDAVADYIGESFGGVAEKSVRDVMKGIQDTFIQEVSTLGGTKAAEHLEQNLNKLDAVFKRFGKQMNEGERKMFHPMQMDLLNNIRTQIEASKNELAKIDKSNTIAESKKLVEIASMEKEKKLLEDQLALAIRLQDEEERGRLLANEINSKAELANDLEILRIQNTKNRLLGDENEAERKLLDLSLRRREIMESGLAAPAELEGMFNAELAAIAADIENKLMKFQSIAVQTDMQSQAQAYTNANRQVLESAKEQKTEEKEMVELLKGIKEHLGGGNMLEVRVQ